MAVAQFDVATIKPHNPDLNGFGIVIRGSRMTAINVSVSSLMAYAYALHPSQIVDGPGWIERARFDVEAKAAEGDATPMKVLVERLLADRFRLTFHRTQKELAVLELVPGKAGLKLADKPGDPSGRGTYGVHALGSMGVHDASMADFASWLQRFVVDRPVIDHTGAAGRYTFELNWKADEFQFAPIARSLPVEPANNDLPDLYTTLEQQLGVRLKSTKAAVEVFAIDRLEKPTEN